MVKDSTEEGGELGIAAGCAGDGVDGSLRIGMLATGVGELGLVACFVFGEECAGFGKGIEIGDVVELAMETFLGKECFLLRGKVFGRDGGRELVEAGDKENLRGATAGFEPAVLVGEFGTFRRILLEEIGRAHV